MWREDAAAVIVVDVAAVESVEPLIISLNFNSQRRT